MKQEKELILASASPRRHEILLLAGMKHRILTVPADESTVPFPENDPEEYVRRLAKLKNDAVWEKCGDSLKNAVILSADTVVWAGGDRPLGKPKDRADSIRMLTELSGREHQVMTGVMLRDTESGKTALFSEVTDVKFRPLDEEEIEHYVDSGDPLDKAGAYGYQSGACIFVEGIRGDYFNVVGLPICRVTVELKKLMNAN